MIQSQGDKRIQELVAHFNKKIQWVSFLNDLVAIFLSLPNLHFFPTPIS
jgi:hypothetical protein